MPSSLTAVSTPIEKALLRIGQCHRGVSRRDGPIGFARFLPDQSLECLRLLARGESCVILLEQRGVPSFALDDKAFVTVGRIRGNQCLIVNVISSHGKDRV